MDVLRYYTSSEMGMLHERLKSAPEATAKSGIKRPRSETRVGFHQLIKTNHVQVTLIAESAYPASWHDKFDYGEAIQAMKQSAIHCREESSFYPIYLELLVSSYVACCDDANEASYASLPMNLTAEHVSFLGLGRGESRGLEIQALPYMGRDRQKRRKAHIQAIVKLSNHLKRLAMPLEGQAQILKEASLQLTRPARKFAHALGSADAVAALAEHAVLEVAKSPPVVTYPIPLNFPIIPIDSSSAEASSEEESSQEGQGPATKRHKTLNSWSSTAA